METTKPKKGMPDDYTQEQSEFLRAVSDFRTMTGQHVLRVTDYLNIVRGLGYRKNPTVPAQN